MEAINEIAAKHDLPGDRRRRPGDRRQAQRQAGVLARLRRVPELLSHEEPRRLRRRRRDLHERRRVRRDAAASSASTARGHTYYHEMIGGMFRLAAIQAAVLDVKLKYLDELARGPPAQRGDLRQAARRQQGRHAARSTQGNWSIYNQYVVRVPDRDAVKQQLADRGIGTAIYYPLPLHLQECFKYLGVQRRRPARNRARLPRSAGAAGLSGTAGGAGEVRRAGSRCVGQCRRG